MKKISVKALIFILSTLILTSCFNTPTTTTPKNNDPVFWGKVYGTVIENDVPLEGVTVRSGERTTTTDKDGKYCIEVYDDGATLYFTMNGHISQSKTLKSSNFYRDEIEYSFIMFISTRVFGRVIDENGTPVAEATVSIGNQRVLTDANGYYEFESVIGTSMIITATKDSRTAKSAVFTDDMREGSCEVSDMILK